MKAKPRKTCKGRRASKTRNTCKGRGHVRHARNVGSPKTQGHVRNPAHAGRRFVFILFSIYSKLRPNTNMYLNIK